MMIDNNANDHSLNLDDIDHVIEKHYKEIDDDVKFLCNSIIQMGIDRTHATLLILISANKAASSITDDKNTFLEFLSLAQFFSTIVDENNNSEEGDSVVRDESLDNIDLLNIKVKGSIH